MCGIAGAVGKGAARLVEEMLREISHRGPDGMGIFESEDIALGNVFLALNGNHRQPIHNKGALTFDGEIYNFSEIAAELGIGMDSESEILFHLIESLGCDSHGVGESLRKIEGDYALAYAGDDGITLARDPIGVKPLFYGFLGGNLVFASEKKALWRIGLQEVKTLEPGSILRYSREVLEIKTGEPFHVNLTLTGVSTSCELTFAGVSTVVETQSKHLPSQEISDEEEAIEKLSRVLSRAVEKRLYKRMGIAFSGGLDSSILAALAKKTSIELYSVGMEGSQDINNVRKAARLLGMEEHLRLHVLTLEEVEASLPQVIRAVESIDPLKVAIGLPLYLVAKDAHDRGIKVMLSGQGADELFAGYKRYEALFEKGNLNHALMEDLNNIARNNLERDDGVTMANSVELRLPFLDENLVKIALSIAPELKIRKDNNRYTRKYILRRTAEAFLPRELAWREKKAVQYSTGIQKALEKLARKKGYKNTRGYLASIMSTCEIEEKKQMHYPSAQREAH